MEGSPIPKSKNREFFGGSPIPKSKIDQKMNIFVKTKNAPKGIECKINHSLFLETRVPIRDRKGGTTFGKNSQKIPFFVLGVAHSTYQLTRICATDIMASREWKRIVKINHL